MPDRDAQCSYREEMQDLYDGLLSPERRDIAESHRASCPECAREYTELARFAALLRGSDPAAASDANRSTVLRAALLSRCAESVAAATAAAAPAPARPLRRRPTGSWRRPWFGGLSAGLIAIAAVIVWIAGVSHHPETAIGRTVGSVPKDNVARSGTQRADIGRVAIAVGHPAERRAQRAPVLIAVAPRQLSAHRADRHVASGESASIRLRPRDRYRPRRAGGTVRAFVAPTAPAAPAPIPARVVLIADASSEDPVTTVSPRVHITIVASGDLRAPSLGGRVAVIRSLMKEPIP